MTDVAIHCAVDLVVMVDGVLVGGKISADDAMAVYAGILRMPAMTDGTAD